MSKKRNVVLNISAKLLLAFICSVLVFGTLALVALKVTFFDETYMTNMAVKSKYHEYVAKEVNVHIQDLGRGSNVPPVILEEIVSEELVAENVELYIRTIYHDEEFMFKNLDIVKSSVVDRILQYAQTQGMELTDESIVTIDRLGEEAVDGFQKYVRLPYLADYARRAVSYEHYIDIFLIVTITCSLLVSLAICLLCKRRWIQIPQYLGYSIGGAGVMMFLLPWLIQRSGVVGRIAILSEGLYTFLTNYFNGVLQYFIKSGAITFGVGIVCVILGEVLWYKVGDAGDSNESKSKARKRRRRPRRRA